MYSLTSANRYYLYQGFVRMNLGIDGLFKIIRSQMKELSPISGDIFLFSLIPQHYYKIFFLST